MAKLKLGPLADDKPVKVTVELPAGLHRDLIAYAEILGRESGRTADPVRLIAPMLEPRLNVTSSVQDLTSGGRPDYRSGTTTPR